MTDLVERLKKAAENIRLDCDLLDTNHTNGADFDAVQEAIAALEAMKKVSDLTDAQILDLCIEGGIYDCLNDPYLRCDGKWSLDVDLVRFGRKLLPQPTPTGEKECR